LVRPRASGLRPVSERERERFARLADVHLEEWSGDGHFVHLVDPGRFATTLRRFIEHCGAAGWARARRRVEKDKPRT
jgi:pimeloyl-ACP methyl ester carboxylesterase